MYVVGIEPSKNRVIVGEEDKIYSNRLMAEKISWVDDLKAESRDKNNNLEKTLEVKAKIRYRHREDDALVTMKSNTDAVVEFINPQRAITPGQAVVFYNGKKVLGGGWINRVL